MSASAGTAAALLKAMQQQTEKLNELVTTEILLAVAGAEATGAYLQQIAVVKQATQAHAQAAAAVKAQAQAAKEWQKKRSFAAENAGTAFGAASQFANTLAQSNSTVWSTLTDSIQLVVMELGSYFIPVIVDVAQGAQQFAEWLHQLSPATKEWLSSLAYGAFALIAFGQANLFTGGLLGQLGQGLLRLVIAGGSTSIALIAVAAAAWFAWNQMRRIVDHGNDVKEKLDEETKKQTTPIEQKASAEELHRTEAYKHLSAIQDPEERRREAARMTREADDKSQQAAKEEEEARAKGSSRLRAFGQTASLGGYSGATDAQDAALQAAEKHTRAMEESDLIHAAARELVLHKDYRPEPGAGGGLSVEPAKVGSKDADSSKTGGSAAKTGKKPGAFAAHQLKIGQPAFNAVEEARRNLQLKSLDQDPLQTMTMRSVLSIDGVLQKVIAGKLDQIASNTKEGKGVS